MKILIKKYKSLENLEISVPAQIGAGNGLGKSTILEAISFVLTGKDLSGNEFKQVYDNRVDLHDAIADVSYFDNYGNEFQRIVKPIFQTNRAGIEEIKIKRSTECRKNSIPCNDFSDDFVDFYKFGTDYFFNQKEDLQRSIFIDILKSKMPDYDVNSASLKLKELKRSQKIEVDAVKSLQDANKNTKDVEIPPMSIGLSQSDYIYSSQLSSINPEAVAEINKKNNTLMDAYFVEKNEKNKYIATLDASINRIKLNIQSETEKLENCKSAKFTPKEIESTEKLEKSIKELTEKLAKIEYFESIEVYAAMYFGNNPVLVGNAVKIKEISEREFVASGEISDKCPLSGDFCETAKIHSESALSVKFIYDKEHSILSLRSENRDILEKEMRAINSEYNACKSDLQEAERKLNNLVESNKRIAAENEFAQKKQVEGRALLLKACSDEVSQLDVKLENLVKELSEKQTELSNLVEPVTEKLPEQLEISIELKQARADYIMTEKEIIGKTAINENNKKLIAERSAEIKAKQFGLLEIIDQITTLTTEISDYFNNLKGIVKAEFSGDIEIDVELLEYVMSRDEYKDCFKITANGKVFPYECNGALQNNVKLQILFNLQRLKGYKGVTVMDNCEANTTQPINTLGLNCVLAFATNDKELIIK